MERAKKIVVKPVISEKSLKLADEENKYTFIVARTAAKQEVADFVAKKFDVKVESVKMLNVLGKKVSFGRKRTSGRRQTYKKAVVTLASGGKINLFEIK